jgi:hypothetical protein
MLAVLEDGSAASKTYRFSGEGAEEMVSGGGGMI